MVGEGKRLSADVTEPVFVRSLAESADSFPVGSVSATMTPHDGAGRSCCKHNIVYLLPSLDSVLLLLLLLLLLLVLEQPRVVCKACKQSIEYSFFPVRWLQVL